MKILNPKTIEEAIQSLQQFLECDLYTKFRPEENFDGKTFIRVDPFKNVNDFHKYIKEHFEVLKQEINSLSKPKGK